MDKFVPKAVIVTLCGLFSVNLAAASSNPASVNYVKDYVNQRIAATTLTAGTGITINNQVISLTPTYSIGESLEGGTIFYLDDTKRHGLMFRILGVAPQGIAPDVTTAVAFGSGIGAGVQNTAIFNASAVIDGGTTGNLNYGTETVTSYAVQADGTVCTPAEGTPPDTSIPCYGGWYIPSMFEAAIIANEGFLFNYSANFWTSTTKPGENNFALIIDKPTGGTNAYTIAGLPKNQPGTTLIAVRQF